MGNWSESPWDLLREIARPLEAAADRARFSLVCRNWSSLVKSENNYLPRSPPWLMLTEKLNSDYRNFVSVDGERFAIELSKGTGSRCVGSVGCWIVMIDAVCDMYILNPFSRVMIDLPSMLTLDDFLIDHPSDSDSDSELEEEGIVLDVRDYYVSKVIFSCSKSQSPVEEDFVAVAIYSSSMKLAYTVKGANSWHTIQSANDRFHDVFFYQDKFYVVNYSGEIYEFVVRCSPDVMMPITIHLISDPLENFIVFNRQLVEFQGLLLQVLNLNVPFIQPSKRNQMSGFLVFKLDFNTGGWVEIKDLGQHSIFLGYNNGVSLLATFNSTFNPNCIYFSTEYYMRMRVDGKMIDIGDVGIFSLADSIIVPYYTGPYSADDLKCPVWIVPTSLFQNPDVNPLS